MDCEIPYTFMYLTFWLGVIFVFTELEKKDL